MVIFASLCGTFAATSLQNCTLRSLGLRNKWLCIFPPVLWHPHPCCYFAQPLSLLALLDVLSSLRFLLGFLVVIRTSRHRIPILSPHPPPSPLVYFVLLSSLRFPLDLLAVIRTSHRCIPILSLLLSLEACSSSLLLLRILKLLQLLDPFSLAVGYLRMLAQALIVVGLHYSQPFLLLPGSQSNFPNQLHFLPFVHCQ